MRVAALTAGLLILAQQPPPNHGQAAYFVAIGTIAMAECPALGFKVNPNGWHALIEYQAPDTTAKDYTKGGKYEAIGHSAFELQASIVKEAGATAWCSYIAAWAKTYHPRIWSDLIARQQP